MERSSRWSLISLFVALLLGGGLAMAGSSTGSSVGGFPLFALLVVIAFAIQWIAFLPAYLFQTERFYDLTGSFTYVTVATTALGFGPDATGRSLLLFALVVVWAVRLGTFLFRRIHQDGGDSRFDDIKPNALRFLNTWTLQGLWVTVTAGAALAAITAGGGTEIDAWAVAGASIWLFGFVIEVVADHQKRRFRADPANEGEFISSGLWSLSRHPNYFGEIVLWIGVAIVAFPALEGWQHVTLISPVFVTLLLTRVSGVPMLEEKADRRWGGRDDYEAYKEKTPILVPRPFGG